MVGSTRSRLKFSADRCSPGGTVARIERSEIRRRPFNAAMPPPGFAGAQPGLPPLQAREAMQRHATRHRRAIVTGALAIIAAATARICLADALHPYVIVG